MSDIPEPLSDSPEGTQNRVESTNWDIGNAALPTAVTANRFDIVSNGSLTVEPVLPMDASQGGKVLGSTSSPLESANLTPKANSRLDTTSMATAPLVESGTVSNSQQANEARIPSSSYEAGQSNSPMASSTARNEGLANIAGKPEIPNRAAALSETTSEMVSARSDVKVNSQYLNNSVSNLAAELVSPRITITKAANDTLPTFELISNQNKEKHVEPVKRDPIESPVLKPVMENNLKAQEGPTKVLARINETVESVLSNKESRALVSRNDVHQTEIHLASNVRIDESFQKVRLSAIKNDVPSLRFQNLVRSASEGFNQHKAATFENLTKASDFIRLVQLPGNLKNFEIARHINLNANFPASFNIKANIDTNFIPSISDRRTPALIGLVKDALTNPGANLTPTIRSDALSAQGILRAQFNTSRSDGLTPLSFTIKDARTGMTSGDTRLPGYLEIGRRKKKKKNGEEDEDECATVSSPESCRYISGLELGLLIALAGIAKQEGPDRTNRKVVKEIQNEKSLSTMKLDFFQTCEFISDAIKQNKIEKRLSSKERDNQFKSANKIKIKNLLRKLKEEMRELSAKDLEKLKSSSTKEELLDRLSKMVANDEKRLFTKRQLSSFGTAKQEILTQQSSPNAPLSNQIVSYRPLWLVTVNDTLTKLAEQIYQDPDVGWLIADMNITRVKERYVNGKRVIELQSRQQIELPIQEDIDLFKMNKSKEATAEKLITIVQVNQLDKELINSQLQALQIKRKAIGTT